MSVHVELEPLERETAALGRKEGDRRESKLVDTPLLSALEKAGTRHVYADTADPEELGAFLSPEPGTLRREVDGNTVNQPLVHKVIDRYLEAGDPEAWVRDLSGRQSRVLPQDLQIYLYALVCGRIGSDMVQAFASGRDWEISLQLHMDLGRRHRMAVRVGHLLREMAPGAFVKVPFMPDEPHCFLVARDLERAGVPVNFTSTFSARQAVAAALLSGVTRTNIFMGRLSQGLGTEFLGEQVCLEAQRRLRDLRRGKRAGTQLIVASMREWKSFPLLAGCDVFTAPVKVLRSYLEQDKLDPESVHSRLDTSYEESLETSDEVKDRIDPDRLARLWRVEPEFIDFLLEYRETSEFGLADGDMLRRRFRKAGFGDFFHDPDPEETAELREGKLPKLDGILVERIPLDTHYSLLANADFSRHQAEIDEAVAERGRIGNR